jgi:hypothetical protein
MTAMCDASALPKRERRQLLNERAVAALIR